MLKIHIYIFWTMFFLDKIESRLGIIGKSKVSLPELNRFIDPCDKVNPFFKDSFPMSC